jgi:hypothetical protein
MVVALILIAIVVAPLGLVGLCAVMRAGQCERLVEATADLAAPPEELRRAA